MTPSQEPECAKNDKDLPATKFDNDFRKCANLDILEDAIFSNGNINFYSGHKNFMSNLIHCYTKQTLNFDTKLHEKRCRDLNYYVDFAIDLVSKVKIRDSRRNTKLLHEQQIDEIKSDINEIFNTRVNFKCSRTEEVYSWEATRRKQLDDYCENRDHLVSCISKGSAECEKLKELVDSNFEKFLSNKCLISNYEEKNNPFNIHQNCTLYDIKKTFSYGTCNNFNIQYDIKDIPPCPSEDLSIWDKFLELINPYISYITNISDIPPYVQYICFGVLGIFIFSLILFKNTLNKGLPSSTFDDKFSESIDLSTLENAALFNEHIDLEEWIKTFTQTFPIKYKEIFNTEDKNIHDKRCRDLNYHLDYIADLILQLASKREHGKKFKIYENYLKTMKQVMESLFDPSSNYSCRRYYKRYVFQMPIRKDLDDFCENRDYLLSSIAKDPGNCDKLISYVNEKYNCLFNDKTCITDAAIIKCHIESNLYHTVQRRKHLLLVIFYNT
ncbi:hypothetical protein PVBG_01339 [Plasmodium vivax Brazil I]|uniref:PIR Superfamily Protein n=1 Tax=Plasmodium vivax (strain Brazil I) TaxID=1033975 RepID=A0A0J9SSG8_PLAV1|nr:hypothetical protein PVBG_01339 [Plasmodium vivax Brazil I]